MAENLKLVIGGDNSQARRALLETQRELAELAASGNAAAAGVNVAANRMAALDEAQRRGRGSAAELAASHRNAVAAARELAGGVGAINQQLLGMRTAREQARALTGEIDAIAAGALRAEAALAAAGAAAAVAFGARSVTAFAQREADILGLTAVAEDAAGSMDRIVEQAKQAGANIAGGLGMVRGLEAAGVSTELAHTAIDAAAKGIARRGGSSSELIEVAQILQQGASMPQVSSDVFRQLAWRFPETKEVMKRAYGSSDPEFVGGLAMSGRESIERLISAWNELEGVGDTTKNQIENVADAWNEAQVAFGRGLVSEEVNAGLVGLAGALDELAPRLEKLGEQWSGLLTGGLQVATWLLDDGPWQKAIRGAVGLTAATVALTAATAAYYSLRARAALLDATGVMGPLAGNMIGRFGSGGIGSMLGGLWTEANSFLMKERTFPWMRRGAITPAAEVAGVTRAGSAARTAFTTSQLYAQAPQAVAELGWHNSIQLARTAGGQEGVARFIAAARDTGGAASRASVAMLGLKNSIASAAAAAGPLALVIGLLAAASSLWERNSRDHRRTLDEREQTEGEMARNRERLIQQYGGMRLPGEDADTAARRQSQMEMASAHLEDAQKKVREVEGRTSALNAGLPFYYGYLAEEAGQTNTFTGGPISTPLYEKWKAEYEAAKAAEAKAQGEWNELSPQFDERYEQVKIAQETLENYKVLAELAKARAQYEQTALDTLRQTVAPAEQLAAAWQELDQRQEEAWAARLKQAAAEDELHPEMKILARVELEIDAERLQQQLRRAQDDLLRYRAMSPDQIAAERQDQRRVADALAARELADAQTRGPEAATDTQRRIMARQHAARSITRWQDLSLQQWHSEREAGLASADARVWAAREALEKSGSNRWEELQALREQQDAATEASWQPRLNAAAASSELQRDPSILVREQQAIEAERIELQARRQSEERDHLKQVAGWEEGLAAALTGEARTRLDLAMQRRRPAAEILALEAEARAAAESELAWRMHVAELQVASGENLLAVEQEATRQATERAQLEQAAWQRRIDLRERDLGWEAGRAGGAQQWAEARLGYAEALGRPARELLALQDQLDEKRHASQRILLEQAAVEVETRRDIYALDRARWQIAGQELQAAQARRQIVLGGMQHEVNLAGTAAGLAQQRYQQTMTLFADPRLRMLAGVNLDDVRGAQQRAMAAQETAWGREQKLADAQGPVAAAEARAAIAMKREAAQFQQMMDERQLMRQQWLMGFTSFGGTPLGLGSGETGFASALIGGDQGRIDDILKAAHRESLKPLQRLHDGLSSLRQPDTAGLREGVLGALRERDKRFMQEFIAAVRAA